MASEAAILSVVARRVALMVSTPVFFNLNYTHSMGMAFSRVCQRFIHKYANYGKTFSDNPTCSACYKIKCHKAQSIFSR
jgi:hypothetical protein